MKKIIKSIICIAFASLLLNPLNVYANEKEEEKIIKEEFQETKENNTVDKAIEWAIKIANDDEYFYGHGNDTDHFKYIYTPNKQYVCTTFVYGAYSYAGAIKEFDVRMNLASNMTPAYLELDFIDVIDEVNLTTGEGLLPGDILVDSNGHTEMYLGTYEDKENQLVGAHGIDNHTKASSISIKDYCYGGYHITWNHVLRYENKQEILLEQIKEIDENKTDIDNIDILTNNIKLISDSIE